MCKWRYNIFVKIITNECLVYVLIVADSLENVLGAVVSY